MPDPALPDTPARSGPNSGLRPYVVLVLLGALPVAGLAIYALRLASSTIERQIVLSNRNAAGLAREKEHDGPIHLLLTDVVLPGPGGREIADAIAGRRPGTRVLFMSGYTDDAIVHRGVLDEGVAFLEKPIRPRALLKTVREVLEDGRSGKGPTGSTSAT